jgi:hypothetical protein
MMDGLVRLVPRAAGCMIMLNGQSCTLKQTLVGSRCVSEFSARIISTGKTYRLQILISFINISSIRANITSSIIASITQYHSQQHHIQVAVRELAGFNRVMSPRSNMPKLPTPCHFSYSSLMQFSALYVYQRFITRDSM